MRCMPLPLAPLIGWLVGIGLAWAARDERVEAPGDGARGWPRAVVVSTALAGFVYAPVIGYFAAFHGDWAYLYLVPWRSVPSALDLLFILGAAATVPLGAAVSRAPARAGRWATLVRLGAGPGIAALVVAGVFARRLAVSASYAQFHGAFGVEPIASSTLGRGVLLAAIALAMAIAWAARALRS
jgi:hypothetical protein